MVLTGAGGRRRRTAAVVALGAVLTASASGCKSGVVPGNAYEGPVELKGLLLSALPEGTHPIATVIWTDPLQRRPDVPMPARWMESTVAPAAASIAGAADPGARAEFALHLFRPPPPEALVDIESSGGDVAELALGELLIVDDVDGDGTFQIDGRGTLLATADGGAHDRYVAGSRQVLVYMARPFPPAVATDFRLAPGTETGYRLLIYLCQGRNLTGTGTSGGAEMEPQIATELIQRRTCMRTHSP